MARWRRLPTTWQAQGCGSRCVSRDKMGHYLNAPRTFHASLARYFLATATAIYRRPSRSSTPADTPPICGYQFHRDWVRHAMDYTALVRHAAPDAVLANVALLPLAACTSASTCPPLGQDGHADKLFTSAAQPQKFPRDGFWHGLLRCCLRRRVRANRGHRQ
jgi:hypothetical protein